MNILTKKICKYFQIGVVKPKVDNKNGSIQALSEDKKMGVA